MFTSKSSKLPLIKYNPLGRDHTPPVIKSEGAPFGGQNQKPVPKPRPYNPLWVDPAQPTIIKRRVEKPRPHVSHVRDMTMIKWLNGDIYYFFSRDTNVRDTEYQ